MEKFQFIRIVNRNTIHSTVQNEAEPSVASTSKRSLEIENDDREKSIAKRAKSDPRILDGTYFEITTRSIDNSNNVKARCTQCGVIRSGSTTGTGNFIRHYTDNHKERYEELLSYIKSNSRILTSSGKTQSTLTMNKVTAERVFFDHILLFLTKSFCSKLKRNNQFIYSTSATRIIAQFCGGTKSCI